MTTFKQFIIENKHFDLAKLKSDCSFFLSLIKGTRGHVLLHHGTKNFPNDFDIKTWKLREKPRDSSTISHEMYNAYFMQKFNAPIRSWLFTTGSFAQADIYGMTTLIFPIGHFEWVCCPSIHDLSELYINKKMQSGHKYDAIPYNERIKQITNEVITDIDNKEWYYNSNLEDCIRSKSEIMIKCDSYYIINVFGETYQTPEFSQFLKSI